MKRKITIKAAKALVTHDLKNQKIKVLLSDIIDRFTVIAEYYKIDMIIGYRDVILHFR